MSTESIPRSAYFKKLKQGDCRSPNNTRWGKLSFLLEYFIHQWAEISFRTFYTVLAKKSVENMSRCASEKPLASQESHISTLHSRQGLAKINDESKITMSGLSPIARAAHASGQTPQLNATAYMPKLFSMLLLLLLRSRLSASLNHALNTSKRIRLHESG